MSGTWVRQASLNEIKVAIERRGSAVVAAYLRFGDGIEGMSFVAHKADGPESDRTIKHVIINRLVFDGLVAAGMPKESGHDVIRVWPYVITASDTIIKAPNQHDVVKNDPAQPSPHLLDLVNSLHELENQIETAEENANGRHEVIIKTMAEQARYAIDREDKLGGLLSRLLTAIEVPHKPTRIGYEDGTLLDLLNRRKLIDEGIIDKPPGSNGRTVCCCGRTGCELSWLRIGTGLVAGSTHTDCGYTLEAKDGIVIDA